eukprot:TRINITY_DN41954_c0_g1_i1.p1 TRINITY_DN41954_c0_g1~~TRINITY_DN41954_c0_g1_i1.p1  ORF type:complete len:131 (+),score=35.88 TRINITY_DN41954_c0_g1_i1:115-507(+)
MIRRPPRSTLSSSSAASDVYKRQQKRWCVLDGRMLMYYDAQGASKPAAALDLKGAKVVTDMKDAKQPNSFGITNIQGGTSGQGMASGGRTFIFSTLNKETMTEWLDALRSVLQEPASDCLLYTSPSPRDS